MPKATDSFRDREGGDRREKNPAPQAGRPASARLRPADGVFRDGERTVDQWFVCLIASRGTLRRAMTVTLHVCITCRAGQSLKEGETTPGARLHAAILDVDVPE